MKKQMIVTGLLLTLSPFSLALATEVDASTRFTDINTGFRCNYSHAWTDTDEVAMRVIAGAEAQCNGPVTRISPWKQTKLSCHEWGKYALSARFECVQPET